MKVLVCGGRHYADRARVYDSIREYNPELIIQGGASGADALARDWARENGIALITMPAMWDTFGRKAGPIRNGWMLRFCRPDVVLAFPGGRGTQNMVEQAKAAGVHVTEVAP